MRTDLEEKLNILSPIPFQEVYKINYLYIKARRDVRNVIIS